VSLWQSCVPTTTFHIYYKLPIFELPPPRGTTVMFSEVITLFLVLDRV
jgi:hypothetical protein